MMKTVAVQSYEELMSLVSRNERSFLLLYKKGSGQSDCAVDRLLAMDLENTGPLALADVGTVKDIHGKLGVETAPSLVVFRRGQAVNIVKGCQTAAAYGSILSGKELGRKRIDGSINQKQVTVYTTPACSWCTTLKTYLNQKKVVYREVNVALDTSAAEAMVRKSGQQGVPQTEINGQMIVGFDKPRINQLLGIQ